MNRNMAAASNSTGKGKGTGVLTNLQDRLNSRQ
jgi:hypothetical protein